MIPLTASLRRLFQEADMMEEHVFTDEPVNENAEEPEVNVDLVQAVLDKIRPYLQFDGGDISLDHVEDGYVYVRMYGACMGCMAIGETLDNGVAALLMDEVPGVKGVVLVDPYGEEQLY